MDLPFDEAFAAYNLERLKTASTVLLGHTSYMMFGGFWPRVENDSSFSDVAREFSKRYNKVEKVVVSNSSVEPVPDWRDTTLIISDDVYTAITRFKRNPGKDIVIWGSRTFWNNLLVHRLIDELHFVVGNVVFGDGTPSFSQPIPTYTSKSVRLKLLETLRADPRSDNIIIKYALKYSHNI